MKNLIIAFLMLLMFSGIYAYAEETVTVSSPDGAVSADIYLNDYGELKYRVLYKNSEIISESSMGLNTSDGNLGSNLTITNISQTENDESYPMITGKASYYRDYYKGADITVTNGARKMTVHTRCYNDGFAFSYELDDGTFIQDELTDFIIPYDCDVNAMEYERCYENFYNNLRLCDLSGTYAVPMLIYENSCYVLLGEANLTAAYCGSALTADGSARLSLDFEPKQTEAVKASGGFNSPWRVVLAGDADTIANTQIFENLCPPCRISDTSWIKPGISTWTWFNGDPTNDPETYKKYISLAVEAGWEYVLLDEGWQPRSDDSGNEKSYDGVYDWVPEIIQYAADRGIGVMVWSTYWDLDTPQKRERLKEWADMGIKGVKIDFFDSETQSMMELYDTLTAECADLRLMVNFHGCTKPTGLRRTYPNLVTCEAVYGTEHFRSGEGWGPTAVHNCTLPFTRNAVGPMDYTPAISDYFEKNYFTDGQRAALPVIFESGIQTFSDKPERYRESIYYDFLKDIPASWDSSKVLDAVPSEYVVMLRQKGDEFYIGSICTGQRAQDVSMSFLESGIYRCEIYTDFGKTVRAVTSADIITLPQKENGGAVIRLTKWSGEYFTDTDAHWCRTYLAPDKINGYFFGDFMPDKAITRAEFVAMLLSAYGIETEAGAPVFGDSINCLFKNEIYTAAKSGLVNGFNDNEFAPDELITREQAAVIIARCKSLPSYPPRFGDRDDISSYALGSVGACEYEGIITGYEDNTFKPKNNITRAEAAAMFMRSR